MNNTALVLEGQVIFEGEHCRCSVLGPGMNHYLSNLFLRHFFPELLQRENWGRTPAIHVGHFRITFEPLEGQGDTLVLEGELGEAEGYQYPEDDMLKVGFFRIFHLSHS